MVGDLDKSIAYIVDRTLEDDTLDAAEEVSIHSSLYADLYEKRKQIDTCVGVKPYRALFNWGIFDIRQLLQYDGRLFVTSAYQMILGREPEEAAVQAFINAEKIDSQRAKTDYLKGIEVSGEGRSKKVHLTGFRELEFTDFLQFSDADFIDNAYVKLCMRKPDSGGREYYLSLLRSHAVAPAEIIYFIRFSQEGKLHGVQVSHLEKAYIKRKMCRFFYGIPLIGRWIRGIVGVARADRHLREVVCENYSSHDRLEEEIIDLKKQIQILSTQISNEFAVQKADTERKIRSSCDLHDDADM